jgi:hypothetical protein
MKIDILGIITNRGREENMQETIELFSRLTILANILRNNDWNVMLQSIRVPSEIMEMFR